MSSLRSGKPSECAATWTQGLVPRVTIQAGMVLCHPWPLGKVWLRAPPIAGCPSTADSVLRLELRYSRWRGPQTSVCLGLEGKQGKREIAGTELKSVAHLAL